MYSNFIISGATNVLNEFPFSGATCIQVEDVKEYSVVKQERRITDFVYNNWNNLEDGKIVDIWWRAENIDTSKWTFDISINGNKRWTGYSYFESWTSIKRVS